MVNHDEVEESTRTEGLIEFPDLGHPHFGAPNLQTRCSEFGTLNEQYKPTSSLYSCRIEGSYKRRCVEQKSIPSYYAPASCPSTLQTEGNLFDDQSLCISSTRIYTTNASTSVDVHSGKTLLESQGIYSPAVSCITEGSAETSCSLENKANEPTAEDLVCYGQLNNFCEVRWPIFDSDYSNISWYGDRYLLLGCQHIRMDLPDRAFHILNTLHSTAGALFDFAGAPNMQSDSSVKNPRGPSWKVSTCILLSTQ